MFGPAGLKHFDKDRDRYAALAFKLIQYLHIYALPVFQHNDEMRKLYSEEELAFMSNQLRELSQQFIGNPHVLYGITPEGTRIPEGNLALARTGLGRLDQFHNPDEAFYLPAGLIYPPHAKNNTIEVGKPVLLPEIIDFSKLPTPDTIKNSKARAKIITTELMYYLAQLLPKTSRGYYSDQE